MVVTRGKKNCKTDVSKTKKKRPSSEKKTYKYKKMIEYLKSHSTFANTYSNFTAKDIINHAIVCLENMYKTPIKRFQLPSVYLLFNSERNEVELNLMMKYGVVRRQKDLDLLKQHGITRECNVNLLENNEVFDWGYIGVYGCTDYDDFRQNSQEKAWKAVQNYVEQRNETMIRVMEIQKNFKGKFILQEQLDYDIVMNLSNYFELMFKFLSKDNLQSDETQYKGKYFENWFNSDMEQVKTRIDRWEDYVAAREKWKLNDGWRLVEDELDLYKQVRHNIKNKFENYFFE